MSESISQHSSGFLKSSLSENLQFMDYKANENKIGKLGLLQK